MPGRVWILWLLFLIRGSFYSTMIPLWEGWDEYAHFAWLEHWNEHGTLPRHDTPFPREISESLKFTPLTEELKWMGPEHFTYEQWWALPAGERAQRSARLASLPPNLRKQPATEAQVFYEAQQPPLYYFFAAIPERIASAWPLRKRVLLLRMLSLLVASLAIPLVWYAAPEIGFYSAALLAIAPGFTIDASRVANDCLAIALSAATLLVLMRRGPGWLLGLLLGAALLSKAYLLSLIPAIVLVRRRQALIPVAIGIAIASWWYARNISLGYAFSGWADRGSTTGIFSGIQRINWISAANIVAKSFLWFGAWSFLTLKSWAYFLLEASGAIGITLALRKRGLGPAWSMALCHIAAMAYGILVLFAAHQTGNIPGWYLWPMAAPLAVLLAAGLGRWTTALVALLAVADVYGALALMMPYYAGFVARNRASAAHTREALSRLNTPVWLAAAWIAATVAILVLAATEPRQRRG